MRNQFFRLAVLVIGLLSAAQVSAQLPSNRVKPAVMYQPGDTVRSPRLGLTAIIPDGWQGVLPRETEVFLLMPVENISAEIYVGLNEKLNLQGQKARWMKGMEMSAGIRLMVGEIATRGSDVISATGVLQGSNTNSQAKIYLEAKCSPAGFCLSYMLTSDSQSFDRAKTALQAVVDNTKFGTPSTESPYLNFDWKRFLSGKVLLMIGYENKSKREDQVVLCDDGSFRSRIKRSGIFKDQAKGYQGSKQGTWQVASHGEKATITFSFSKLPSVDVNLEVRDEEIYINGSRYFVGEDDSCK